MIAFTYSGQGSQEPGMGAPWVNHPSWELVDEASQAAGRDVSHLLLDADADELRETRNAQLATFVTSMVVLDAVERLGIDAAGHAGPSLGEYRALRTCVRRLIRENVYSSRVLVCTDSNVVLGAVAKGRSRSTRCWRTRTLPRLCSRWRWRVGLKRRDCTPSLRWRL